MPVLQPFFEPGFESLDNCRILFRNVRCFGVRSSVFVQFNVTVLMRDEAMCVGSNGLRSRIADGDMAACVRILELWDK